MHLHRVRDVSLRQLRQSHMHEKVSQMSLSLSWCLGDPVDDCLEDLKGHNMTRRRLPDLFLGIHFQVVSLQQVSQMIEGDRSKLGAGSQFLASK